MAELKPCPFCGGEATIIGVRTLGYAKCLNCEAETRLTGKAISAWNRRTADPVAEQMEKLRSSTSVKPGRKMRAVHLVAGAVGPISCDSADNLLILADRRVAALEKVAEQMYEALNTLITMLEATEACLMTWNQTGSPVNTVYGVEQARAAIAAYEKEKR